jgi:hypothetical protein
MKSWGKAHDTHRGPTMVMATRLRNLGVRSISVGVVATRAWGGSIIVLESNRQCLRADKECITLGDDEGERQIRETRRGGA